MASFSDKEFAARLVADLRATVTNDPGTGAVSFSGGLFDEQKCLLGDLLRINEQIPAEEVSRITRAALFSAATAPGLTMKRFIAAASRLEQEYLSRRSSRYVLLTQVSIDRRAQLPRTVQDGVTISFPPTVPAAFLDARLGAIGHAAKSLYVDPPKDYRWVRASVTALSVIAAGDLALDAVQFLIALWNLAINRRTGSRWSSGKRQPVNALGLAPIHTLHEPSGKLPTDMWWYEPNYVAPLRPASRHVAAAVDFGKAVRARLGRLPYTEHFKNCVRYYGRALGEADWATAYILLWQALESVTDTSRTGYKATVRRAAFLCDDFDYHRRVLDDLKDCRNQLVHAQNDPTSLESRLYMLKRYVEAGLVFHVAHAGDFESLEEAVQFLELPSSTKLLRRRMRLLEKAAKFRGA